MDNRGHPARRAAVLLALLVLAAALVLPAAALRNPAAVYCTALNYSYAVTTGPDGSMSGSCTLPDHRKVDEWQFLLGQAAPEYSYGARMGYRLETVNDSVTCRAFLTPSCAVCVLPDGSRTEVTKLMGLDFRERLCSGGKCCDPARDTACSFATGTPPGTLGYIIGGAIAVAAIAAGVLLFLRRKKGEGKGT